MITIYISIKGKQMKQFIDFYMVVISPWCYLGLNRLISISNTYDIKINIKPIDIFSIFKEFQIYSFKFFAFNFWLAFFLLHNKYKFISQYT